MSCEASDGYPYTVSYRSRDKAPSPADGREPGAYAQWRLQGIGRTTRRATAPSNSAEQQRQATAPSNSAKQQRQATAPSNSAKQQRQATAPSNSAKQQRQATSHHDWLSLQVKRAFDRLEAGAATFVDHETAKSRMAERKSRIRARDLAPVIGDSKGRRGSDKA